MSDTKTFSISRHFKRTIEIDDGEDGVIRLPVCIRRFTRTDQLEFEKRWKPIQDPPHLRVIHRLPDGDEQEKFELPSKTGPPLKLFTISDDEVRRRRLAELSPEQLAVFEAACQKHDEDISAFGHWAIEQHVWLQPGVEFDVDGDAVDTPKKLADLLAGNTSVLAEVPVLIWNENTMSTDAKKRWRSRLASTPGSERPTAPGGTPAGTAGAAEPAASAATVGASAGPGPTPSGSSRPETES